MSKTRIAAVDYFSQQKTSCIGLSHAYHHRVYRGALSQNCSLTLSLMKLARNPLQTRIPSIRLCIDEAGRGPLAGPVFVGVILPRQHLTPDSQFRDSKQMTEHDRNHAYHRILEYQQNGLLTAATGYATAGEIDRRWIIKALRYAVCRGIYNVLKLSYYTSRREQLVQSPYGEDLLAVIQFDNFFTTTLWTPTLVKKILAIPHSARRLESVLLDGNHTFWLDTALECTIIPIVKGDQKNQAISMTSILAKVERDRFMTAVDTLFPAYHFANHKGYGTKAHRTALATHGISSLHRTTYCKRFSNTSAPTKTIRHMMFYTRVSQTAQRLVQYTVPKENVQQKPSLLLHICCAPDLTRPLHRLKEHFKLHLFRYNPNIHPRPEHEKRYAQFLKLVGLEKDDYEIIEDRYDPKEFFAAMVHQKETIHPSLHNAPARKVLQIAGEMEERSDRCNPCYSMRLHQAAKSAAQHDIPYFTSTLLISPKKHGEKLFLRWCEAEKQNPGTKFLRFDFAKNEGYTNAVHLTRKHGLRRQNYCGCGRTIPKDGKPQQWYSGG